MARIMAEDGVEPQEIVAAVEWAFDLPHDVAMEVTTSSLRFIQERQIQDTHDRVVLDYLEQESHGNQ